LLVSKERVMGRNLLAIGLGLLALPALAQQADPDTISVCEVLREPLKYDGKIVAVRGRLDYGGGEGTWLEDDCTEKHTTAGGLEWFNLIWTSPQPSDAAHQIAFVPISGEHAVDNLKRFVAEILKGQERYRLWATYVGLFEAKDYKTAVYVTRGRPMLGGFGHLGMAPAQLFIKSIKDPMIEPRP
jgi:hypothetical protein